MAPATDNLAAHPSPARSRVAVPALLAALAAGPLAWAAQLWVNYPLSSASCYPHELPLGEGIPGGGGAWYGLVAINLSMIAVALAATVASWRYWQATRHEHAGASRHALEAGEGRTRFIALAGMMAGLGFTAALVFDLIALLVVPQCYG